jgi:hypothetical protein
MLAMMLLLAPVALAQDHVAYSVQGTNPDGTAYHGAFEGVRQPDGAWVLTWRIGASVVRGIGLVQGEVLAVAYPADGGAPGVATYRILPDGRLEGSWTIGEGLGQETLTPR